MRCNLWPHLDDPELVLLVNVKSLLGCTQLMLNLKVKKKKKTFVGDGVGTSVFFHLKIVIFLQKFRGGHL